METSDVFEIGKTVYLDGVSAVITQEDSEKKSEYSKPDATAYKINDTNEGEITVVPWGESNDLPLLMVEKIYSNPIMSQGMLFNARLGYGEGILPVKKSLINNKIVLTPALDNKEINEFFDNNDINGYLMEQITDFNFFYNVFPELVLNLENPRKIVELNHLEAVFSRWTEMDTKTRKIEFHAYSSKFGVEAPKKEDIIVTPVLDPKNPLLDLKRRLGLEPQRDGKTKVEKKNRYIVPVSFPTPGRYYYQKPYWYSIVESGWFDFAQQIPAFKKALLTNQMTIKYHVQLSENYWKLLFAAEGITTAEAKATRRLKEYDNIKNFLTDTKNTGKSVISYVTYSPDGKEMATMKITAIENNFKGGEYIEDLEEALNILSYGMDIHPSLIGAAPGKNKNINGTEARELFIIKQALLKPIRDRILMPIYIVKAINKWPEDIYFTIPNLELTTIDKGTGSQKVIS